MELYADSEIDPVFRQVVSHWLTKLTAAKENKRKVFQAAADECMSFYNGPRSWDDLMGGEGGLGQAKDTIDPSFKVSVNKTFEFVTIFGPVLFSENPVRTVKPRMPVVIPQEFFPNPMVYQAMVQAENQRVMIDGLRSVLLEAYLNWTPVEFRLNEAARQTIEEALIKGRGCSWTELYTPPGTDMRVVRTFFDSVDNLQVDPDAECVERCMWVARRCVHPVWQVERDFGLRPGSLKGNVESQAKQADIETDDDHQYDRKRGYTNDLLRYWKIYSKMGIGGRLQGVNQHYKEPLEIFGDYCYLAIADNCPFPLNLSPDAIKNPNPQEIFARTAWPTPFWGDDEFPVTLLDFHKIPQSPWPLAHLKAGMGELKFLNWCMSFLMGKIRNTTRDFIAVLKEASEEMKTALLEGKDLTLLEIDGEHKNINEIVTFLQHPEVNGDIWKMIAAVEENFDKRVGLVELMYGNQGSTQIRSAAEANTRSQNQSIRPDDMRKVVEAWMTRVAVKEAVCARYHLKGADVAPVFGQMGAWAWTQFVSTRDVNEACRSLEYRIEAGSTQRPNKNWEQETMASAFTSLMPVLQTYAQATGDTVPMNNLLADFAKSRDLDPNRYQLTATVPTAVPAPAGAPGHQESATTNIPAPG